MSVYVVVAGQVSPADLKLAAAILEPGAVMRPGEMTLWHGSKYTAFIAEVSRHATRVPPKPRKRKVAR